jgi:hypothetical protein
MIGNARLQVGERIGRIGAFSHVGRNSCRGFGFLLGHASSAVSNNAANWIKYLSIFARTARRDAFVDLFGNLAAGAEMSRRSHLTSAECDRI